MSVAEVVCISAATVVSLGGIAVGTVAFMWRLARRTNRRNA